MFTFPSDSIDAPTEACGWSKPYYRKGDNDRSTPTTMTPIEDINQSGPSGANVSRVDQRKYT